MGTDIHLLIEVSHRGEPWRPLQRMQNGPYSGPRDYELFSILANVRNRAGLGTRTWKTPGKAVTPDGEEVEVPGFWYDTDDGGHEPITPIVAKPRGVPEDASLTWKATVALWEGRGAEIITTWLDAEELQDSELWSQIVTRDGYVSEEDYLAFRDNAITPTIYATEVGGPGNRGVTVEEYEAGERGEHSTSVFMKWVVGTVRETTGNFIETMTTLAAGTPPFTRLRFLLLFES